MLGGILLALLVVVLEVVLWQPWFRVRNVEASGPDADALAGFVKQELSGTWFYLAPRNSIFFLPERELRARILAAHPDLAAVSLSPAGLATLSVRTISRESIFWWCGTSRALALDTCYGTDAEGLIYEQVAPNASSTDTGMLRVYAAVADADASRQSPVGAHLASTSHIPGVIQFVKAMRELGADVVAVDLRDDEADLYTKAGTRITYVVGKEQEAAALAASAFPSFDLNDGSLQYVDLRFSGKAYFKKKGE